MNKRIMTIRKNAGLSQEEFAKKVGLSRNYISLVENGNRTLADRTVSDICRIFSVNEQWLRTGSGVPYITTEDERTGYISDLLKGEDDEFCDLIIAIMKTYSKLGEKEKVILRNFAKTLANNISTAKKEDKIQRELDAYRNELELEARQAAKLSASGSHGAGLERKAE